ncbi:helix-turn-helix domain-containing protein [Floccifex sp.]|uniref:helix-turn-helix domain-containing protein n=1 Tax=Floccifex sp. TaxID=2815810 RepID=UPI003F06AFD8
MDQKRIGSFLKKLRKEKHLTQEQLAEKLNVSNRTISRWETGNNMPDISILVEISEFYEVSILEIINGERKSEKMEEVKETVEGMAIYATLEKETMIKNIRNISFIGTIAIVVSIILEYIPIKSSNLICFISLYCTALIPVTVFMIFLHASGLLYKLKHRDIVVNLPMPVKYSIALIIAFTLSIGIQFIFR